MAVAATVMPTLRAMFMRVPPSLKGPRNGPCPKSCWTAPRGDSEQLPHKSALQDPAMHRSALQRADPHVGESDGEEFFSWGQRCRVRLVGG